MPLSVAFAIFETRPANDADPVASLASRLVDHLGERGEGQTFFFVSPEGLADLDAANLIDYIGRGRGIIGRDIPICLGRVVCVVNDL